MVRDSSWSDNIAPEGDGMGLFGSHDIRIVDNTFRNNPGPGIHVEDSPDNLIKGNRFSHSARNPDEAEPQRGARQPLRSKRGGVSSARQPKRGRPQPPRPRRAGIGIDKGRHNLVARNVVIDARGRGISLGVDFADGTSIGGVDNIVRRNVVRGSGGDGFLVNKKGSSLLKRNVASGAKDDGFHIESRSTRLTKNRATRNAAIGIEAVQGVIDGGGNRANGNGDPRQCVTREMPRAVCEVTPSKPPGCRSTLFTLVSSRIAG